MYRPFSYPNIYYRSNICQALSKVLLCDKALLLRESQPEGKDAQGGCDMIYISKPADVPQHIEAGNGW